MATPQPPEMNIREIPTDALLVDLRVETHGHNITIVTANAGLGLTIKFNNQRAKGLPMVEGDSVDFPFNVLWINTTLAVAGGTLRLFIGNEEADFTPAP